MGAANGGAKAMIKRLPLLLVADTSTPEALGSKFLRGAVDAGIDPAKEIRVSYTSPAPGYSPSMRKHRGKIFYRLADRRSWEWWEFQYQLARQIQELQPHLVLVTGILPLSTEIFKSIRRNGGRIVNYLTDDPWNPIHRRRCFIANLKLYDHIFSTKQALRDRLETAGALSTSWLPFAYDPYLHHPPKSPEPEPADVVFVGTGAKERLPWLQAIGDIPGITRRLHGNDWHRLATPGWQRSNAVSGEAYGQAIHGARVALGLLRQANGDLSTDRSYEIGAIGGCGLYQDSSEHRNLLQDYPDAGFFSSPLELKKRVQELLEDPKLQQLLRERGAKALRQQQHTYAERLHTIMSSSTGSQ